MLVKLATEYLILTILHMHLAPMLTIDKSWSDVRNTYICKDIRKRRDIAFRALFKVKGYLTRRIS